MTYIIDHANILKNQELLKASLLIDKGTILSIRQSFNKYKYIRMNAEPYIMTPTSILFKKEIPIEKTFQELKKFFIEEFILKGCTAFLTTARINHEYELSEKLRRIKVQLINSPIDYFIGIVIPARLLTTSFVRKCKKEKIPAVMIEIESVDELKNIPWGWLREALFPYNSCLIPDFTCINKKEEKKVQEEWNRVMEAEKLPHLKEQINENHPIPLHIMAQIGIYPLKGRIGQGSELSYNLYINNKEFENLDEERLFYNYKDKLLVTVHKGEIIRSGKDVVFRPGYGSHVKIITPSFFKIEV